MYTQGIPPEIQSPAHWNVMGRSVPAPPFMLSRGSILLAPSYDCNFTITVIFLHGLGRLTCSGIDASPSFPGASAIPSSPGFVGEGVSRGSGVVHSFEVVDPVLFVFVSHVLYSRDL